MPTDPQSTLNRSCRNGLVVNVPDNARPCGPLGGRLTPQPEPSEPPPQFWLQFARSGTDNPPGATLTPGATLSFNMNLGADFDALAAEGLTTFTASITGMTDTPTIFAIRGFDTSGEATPTGFEGVGVVPPSGQPRVLGISYTVTEQDAANGTLTITATVPEANTVLFSDPVQDGPGNTVSYTWPVEAAPAP